MPQLEDLLRPILERAVRFNIDCASIDEKEEQIATSVQEVVAALTDARLILPPGTKPREEFGDHVVYTYGGEVVSEGVDLCDPTGETYCRQQGHQHDRRRTVHTGPWREVVS